MDVWTLSWGSHIGRIKWRRLFSTVLPNVNTYGRIMRKREAEWSWIVRRVQLPVCRLSTRNHHTSAFWALHDGVNRATFSSPRSHRVSYARGGQSATPLCSRAEEFSQGCKWPLKNSALKHGGLVAWKRIRNSVSTKLPSVSERPLQLTGSTGAWLRHT